MWLSASGYITQMGALGFMDDDKGKFKVLRHSFVFYTDSCEFLIFSCSAHFYLKAREYLLDLDEKRGVHLLINYKQYAEGLECLIRNYQILENEEND